MGTLSVQFTGFTTLPSAVSKSYSTFSDPDLQKIIAWAKVHLFGLINQMFNPSGSPSFVPTSSQVLQAWVQFWVNDAIMSQQAFATALPAPPPPVVIGP